MNCFFSIIINLRELEEDQNMALLGFWASLKYGVTEKKCAKCGITISEDELFVHSRICQKINHVPIMVLQKNLAKYFATSWVYNLL